MRSGMVMLMVVAVGLMVGGCAADRAHPASRQSASRVSAKGSLTAQPTKAAPITNTDACAAQMHDLCGAFLLYFVDHGELPQSLSELQAMPGGGTLPILVCPVSHLPYIYNPSDIYMAQRQAQLILYDAAPSHGGMRWGIIAEDAGDGGDGVPTLKVIALPESMFLLHPPAQP